MRVGGPADGDRYVFGAEWPLTVRRRPPVTLMGVIRNIFRLPSAGDRVAPALNSFAIMGYTGDYTARQSADPTPI